MNPPTDSGWSKPFKFNIYSGAGMKICMIRSTSSNTIIKPNEKRSVNKAVCRGIGLRRSLLNKGSLWEIKNQNRGTSMNPCPRIKEINV
jgi:hypothetical protein